MSSIDDVIRGILGISFMVSQGKISLMFVLVNLIDLGLFHN